MNQNNVSVYMVETITRDGLTITIQIRRETLESEQDRQATYARHEKAVQGVQAMLDSIQKG